MCLLHVILHVEFSGCDILTAENFTSKSNTLVHCLDMFFQPFSGGKLLATLLTCEGHAAMPMAAAAVLAFLPMPEGEGWNYVRNAQALQGHLLALVKRVAT